MITCIVAIQGVKMYKQIINKFIEAVNKYNEGGEYKNYGTPWKFSKSEIHMIEVIGDNKGISITEAAKILGVTKGAVSQSVNKLIQRGMVKKERVSQQEKTVALFLTEDGIKPYTGHMEYHKNFIAHFKNGLDKYSKEDCERVIEILDIFINS